MQVTRLFSKMFCKTIGKNAGKTNCYFFNKIFDLPIDKQLTKGYNADTDIC